MVVDRDWLEGHENIGIDGKYHDYGETSNNETDSQIRDDYSTYTGRSEYY